MYTDITLTPGPRLKANPHALDGFVVEAALFDVDNTLVGNGSSDVPSERFRQAVAAAQQAGISVGIASARQPSKVAHILDYIQADGLTILYNGGQIIDNNQSIVAEWYISPETCTKLIPQLNQLGVSYWINDDGTDYFPTTDGDGFEHQTDRWQADSPRVAALDYKPTKAFVINLHDVTTEQAEATSQIVAACGDDNLTTLIAHEVSQADGSKLYDQFIVDKRANKQAALNEVARLQNIPLDHFIAVGDGRNDAVLVGSAGIGVAMGNSAQETLAVATYIAPNREDDGAAIALEQLIKFAQK